MAQMNMQQMMKQARKMQEQLAKAEEELAQTEVSSSAGGGMVKVSATGSMKITSIKIDPDAVDPDDVELASRQMGALTGGLNIPGLM